MLVFFFHIPKTAGTSINVAARSALSNSSIINVDDRRLSRLAPRLKRVADKREIYLAQGHIGPSAEMFSIPMKRITVLRSPLNRLISHFCYSYERRNFDLDQRAFFRSRKNYESARFDMEDLVAWVEHFNADDLHVRYLSVQHDEKITEEDLDRALATSNRLDYVGTTENLRELYDVLGKLTGKPFELDVSPHVNKTGRDRINLSKTDLDLADRLFCRRDNILLAHCKKRQPEQYETISKEKLAASDETSRRKNTGTLGISFNRNLYEIAFKAKRKALGLLLEGLDYFH